MRVVSLVPSWTETLIEAGIEVVGRTRYCVHPKGPIESIAPVGGTKDWNFEAILALKPDLIVLDREENPKFMAEQAEKSGLKWIATHVGKRADVPVEIERLAEALPGGRWKTLLNGWRAQAAAPPWPTWAGGDFPGLMEWGKKPEQPVTRVEYVIWRNPWMVISRGTFIGSMIEHCGFREILGGNFEQPYPELDLAQLPHPQSTLLLFSSEPFPFAKVFPSLAALGCPYALVDGECFSWFGVRTLAFLERHNPRA
ncbi:MAG: helical backbone metal receptor [Bdellovibrionales bacterium]